MMWAPLALALLIAEIRRLGAMLSLAAREAKLVHLSEVPQVDLREERALKLVRQRSRLDERGDGALETL